MNLIRCKTDGEGSVAVCESFSFANGGRIGKSPSQRHHIFRHDADERHAYTARVRVSFERRPGTLLAEGLHTGPICHGKPARWYLRSVRKLINPAVMSGPSG